MTAPLRAGSVRFEKAFGRDYAWTSGAQIPGDVSMLAETLAELAVEIRSKIVALLWVDAQACILRVAGDRLDHCDRLAATATLDWLHDLPRATNFVLAALDAAMQTSVAIETSTLTPPLCDDPAPPQLTHAIRLGLPTTVPLEFVAGLGETPTDRYRGFVFAGEKAQWSPMLRGLLTINFTPPGRSPEHHATVAALETWTPTPQLWEELDRLDTDTAQAMVRYAADPGHPRDRVPKDGRADRFVAALLSEIPDGTTRVRTLRTTLAPRPLTPELLALAIPQVSTTSRTALADSLRGRTCTLGNAQVDELDDAGLLKAFVPIKALPADTLERRPATVASMLEADGVARADIDFLLDRPGAQPSPTLAKSAAVAVAHGLAAPRNALLNTAAAGDLAAARALAEAWGGFAAAVFDTLEGRWSTQLVAADAVRVIEPTLLRLRRAHALTTYLGEASQTPLPADWHGILRGLLTASEVRSLVLAQAPGARLRALSWVRDAVGDDAPADPATLHVDDPWLEVLLAADPWPTLEALVQRGLLRDIAAAERVASLVTRLDSERELCVHALTHTGVLPRLERVRPALFRSVMESLDPVEVYQTLIAGPAHGVAVDRSVWAWLARTLPGAPTRPMRTQIHRHAAMLHAMYQQTGWPTLSLGIQTRQDALRALGTALGLDAQDGGRSGTHPDGAGRQEEP